MAIHKEYIRHIKEILEIREQNYKKLMEKSKQDFYSVLDIVREENEYCKNNSEKIIDNAKKELSYCASNSIFMSDCLFLGIDNPRVILFPELFTIVPLNDKQVAAYGSMKFLYELFEQFNPIFTKEKDSIYLIIKDLPLYTHPKYDPYSDSDIKKE
jgi:hypothetical protein